MINSKNSFSLTPGSVSIILGVISIILHPMMGPLLGKATTIELKMLVVLIETFTTGIIAICGLFFGIKGLKLDKKNLALIGITISSVGLLLCIGGFIFPYVMINY